MTSISAPSSLSTRAIEFDPRATASIAVVSTSLSRWIKYIEKWNKVRVGRHRKEVQRNRINPCVSLLCGCSHVYLFNITTFNNLRHSVYYRHRNLIAIRVTLHNNITYR